MMKTASALWRNHFGCRNSCEQVVIVLFLLELFAFICTAGDLSFPQSQDKFFGKYLPFRKLAIDSKGSNIYIGGKNGILHLDRNLLYLQHYETGSGIPGSLCKDTPTADDYTQILQLDLSERFLITCGTVCQGSCYKTNALNISDRIFNDDQNIVNSNKDKTTRSLISNVTYGSINKEVDQVLFVTAPVSDQTKMLISARNVLEDDNILHPFELKISSKVYQIELKYNPNTQNNITADKFNFRSMFRDDNFLYFLTSVDGIENPSRIIKICTTTDGQQQYNSYEDIPIACNSGSKQYTLIQSGQVMTVGQIPVLLATFTDTTYSGTAVCSYTMDDVLQTFATARLEFLGCLGAAYEPPYMYNPNRGKPCCNISEDFCNKTFSEPKYCNSGMFFENIVMDSHLLVDKAVLNLPGVYSITGSGRVINGVTELYLGSSSGNVKKFHMQDPSRVLNADGVDMIQTGSPVLDIQMRGMDDVFVLSEEKLMKLGKTRCEMANTCNECMNLDDARCGWCILSQSCTEYNSTCSVGNFWLSSAQGKCLKANPEGPGINVEVTTTKTLKFSFVPEINITASEKSWKCVYNKTLKNSEMLKSVDLSHESGCIFEFSAKDEGLKTVLINYGNTTVAETELFIYQCKSLKTSCFECNDERAICNWCSAENKCMSSTCLSNTASKKEECPQIIEQVKSQKLPNNRPENVTLKGKNFELGGDYRCQINGKSFQARWIAADEIICINVNVGFSGMFGKRVTNAEVTYNNFKIDNRENIEVYQCQYLETSSCSICHYLKDSEEYKCNWCDNRCLFNDGSCGAEKQVCRAPVITEVVPRNGPVFGNTLLTIKGYELGAKKTDIDMLTVAGINCSDVIVNSKEQQITCKTGTIGTKKSGSVNVMVKGKDSNNNVTFHYLKPVITSFSPQRGIRNGYTKLTITGSNLYIGNTDNIVVRFTYDSKSKFIPCQIYKDPLEKETIHTITCRTGKLDSEKLINMTDLQILYQNGSSDPVEKQQQFSYVENPSISSKEPKKIMNRGGITMTMKGAGFSALTESNILRNKDNKPTKCDRKNDTTIFCVIPGKVVYRQKRSVDNGEQTFTIQLDGYHETVTILYVDNPSVQNFGKKTVDQSEDDTIYLVIQGKNFLLGASRSEYTVTLSSETDTKDCEILTITDTNFTCKVQADKSGEYTVRVQIGTVYTVEVGTVVIPQSILLYIIIGVLGAVAIIAPILVCVAWRITVRRKNMEIYKMKTHVETMELNIRNRSREEFANMQTSMKDVKGDLVSTGIPYHTYQAYTMHLLFPKMEEDSYKYFQQEGELPDDFHRKKAPGGLLAFEELLFNKYFLMSLIKTLERQNKFNRQNMAEFSSVLSLVLLGRMQYFYEVVELLLENMISSAPRKKYKTLFRRFDTISLRLLSDWLSLALYPYLKDGGGNQLFMLYKATQTVMEKNPVDAVTLDAKDTLAEERLLKIDVSHYKQLTLDIDVNGNGNLYKCHVLDCDTVTQTKAKCLYQIFKNKPASELATVDELTLEWRAGERGHLTLSDIDNTSERKDGFVRHNTLKHYHVQSGSHLALLIEDGDDDSVPDYENVMNNIKKPGTEENGVSASHVLISVPNNHTSEQEKPWHLVPPEDDDIPDELFLNRLLHTKLKLHEYIKAVFDNILDVTRMPPVVEHFFSKLDRLGKAYGAEQDVINCWRNECYAIRIWANWISQPESLFDIHKAQHVMPCLDVVKQVLVDVFTMSSTKLSMDSPSQKLLFANEVPKFQEDVNRFYKELAIKDTVTSEHFSDTLRTLSRSQADVKARKLAALASLYTIIAKYVDEIISDLDEDNNTKGLDLGQKLDSVVQQMDELKTIK